MIFTDIILLSGIGIFVGMCIIGIYVILNE